MHGRVGDSPIIGAALYVDNEVGAACATGVGEAVIRTVGSFLIVELMRQGHTPEEACREAIGRVVRRHPGDDDLQVGYLAMSRGGEIGACSVRPGFQYAVHDTSGNVLLDSGSWFES
jgi:isoaspartyl peptidase/L-asparaginase-like protein (Ntn-hydrolase superfamily)